MTTTHRLRRPLLLAVPLAVCLLVAAASLAWWLATGNLIAAAREWQRARMADGYVVLAGEPVRAGWPLRAVVMVPDVTVATASPGQPDSLAWRSDAVRLVYAPWHPGLVALRLGGTQSVQSGAAAPVALRAGQLAVDVALSTAPGPPAVTVTGRDLRMALEEGEAQAGAIALHLHGAQAELSVSRLTLPGHALPFGGAVAWLEVQVRSTVPVPVLRDPRAVLAAWHAAGGVLLVDALSLRWGKLDVVGQGRLALDAAMQPEGTGTVRLTGFADAVAVLVQAGAITRNDGRVAATLLGLLSSPGPDGVPQAEFPVSLHDRVLSAGTVPLLRFPALSMP